MESLSQICLQNLDLASALASINYFSKYLSSIVISLNSTHQQVGECYFSHWRHNGRQSFHHEKKMCWGEKCRLTKKKRGKGADWLTERFYKEKGCWKRISLPWQPGCLRVLTKTFMTFLLPTNFFVERKLPTSFPTRKNFKAGASMPNLQHWGATYFTSFFTCLAFFDV